MNLPLFDSGEDRGRPGLRLCVLASGSRANSLYLRWGETRILIDAGLGIRSLVQALETVGDTPEGLSAVFVTHEHNDHVRGLPKLLKRVPLPLYASEGTLTALNGKLANTGTAMPLNGEAVRIGDFQVQAIPVRHDSAEPVGFFVTAGAHRITIATDLGEVTPEVADALSRSTCAVFESNHDEEMLENGPYPEILKRRIASGIGHLSNRQTADALRRFQQQNNSGDGNGLRTLILAHLSDENNDPKLARDAVEEILIGCGVDIHVTARRAPGPYLNLDPLQS